MAAPGAGDAVVQTALIIPAWIQAGLDDGSLIRSGGIVRHVVGGAIAKHLDEVPRPDQVIEQAVRRAARLSPKIVMPAMLITAVGAGTAIVIKRRTSARRGDVVGARTADVPQCVRDFEASLGAYVAAGRDASLEADVVDRLIKHLDEVQAWSDDGNGVAFSFEQLEPLFRLVIEHTPVLASTYSVELADVKHRSSEADRAVVVQLRQHLEEQKRILRLAA
jgi:hypothetical protein